jgi:hypothetical protein
VRKMPRFEYESAPGCMFLNVEAAGAGSHFGSFTDDASLVWSDEQIVDFIRGGRRDLFNRFQRLPVSSATLPTAISIGLHFLTPNERILVNQSKSIAACDTTTTSQNLISTQQCQHATMYRNKTLKLQHKRYIQAQVLSKYSAWSMQPQCSMCLTVVRC